MNTKPNTGKMPVARAEATDVARPLLGIRYPTSFAIPSPVFSVTASKLPGAITAICS